MNIRTGSFVTGGQYSSQMRAGSLFRLTIDVLGRVWIRQGERYWSYRLVHVFPRGGITAVRYRDEVLEPIVRPYAGAIGDAFILMQDNARAHTARLSMTFLDDEGSTVMNWPARSPDLNPIEHACDVSDNDNINQKVYSPLPMPSFRNGRPYPRMTSGGSSGVCHVVVRSVRMLGEAIRVIDERICQH